MIRHFFKFSFRRIRRDLVFSIINIVGLSIGLALSFMILLYVSDSFNFDKFHKNRNNTYRIILNSEKWSYRSAENSYMFSDRIKEEMTGIMEVLSISQYTSTLKLQNHEEPQFEKNMYYVDNNIFKVMSFELEFGDPDTALDNPFSIVMTKKMASKYFDEENPIGQSITIITRDKEYEVQLTGILKDIPRLSTFRPEILLTAEFGKINREENINKNKYNTTDCYIYLLLNDKENKADVEGKLTNLLIKYLPETEDKLELQNIKNIYLGSLGIWDNDLLKGNAKNVKVFSIIGILILLISCINYIIISIAQSSSRNKEIAIKKVVGSSRSKLIKQILNESVLLVLLALPTALVLVEIFLPVINNLFKVELKLNYINEPRYLIIMIIITIIVGLLSGVYIALYLSKLKPVSIFKQKLRLKGSKNYFGKALIIFQVLIFTGLIFTCLVIYKQINYAKSIDQGFNKNNLLSMKCIYTNSNNIFTNPLKTKYQYFIESIKQNSDIINASGCVIGPITRSSGQSSYINPENPDQKVIFESLSVKHDFVETLEFEIIEGRSFSDKLTSDSISAVILNEEGIKAFGLTDPIGKIIKKGESEYIIIGVVKNFFMHSVHELISPMIINIAPDKFIMEVIVRYRPEKIKQVLNFLEEKLNKIDPEAPFKVDYYKEKIDNLYKSEISFGRNIIIFSIIAIFTATLGLFGFSLYMSRQRIKEIGIRKVLGGSVFGINKNINKEFIVLSIIANIIAQPIVWIIMNNWLQNYSYRISIGIDISVLSFLISTLIVLLTISININLAIRKNPIDTLRYE